MNTAKDVLDWMATWTSQQREEYQELAERVEAENRDSKISNNEIDRLRIIERDLTEALIMSLSEDKRLLKVRDDLKKLIAELM